MQKNPLVSLIIPVYNDAEFLRDSLDSAINQTLQDIEIICVNDGSTNNSLAVMNEYAKKDSRIRIINKPENAGTLIARKDGVAKAKGNFTMFLDADDCLAPNACETAYNLIAGDDADILKFSYAVHEYSEAGNISNIRVENPDCGEIFDKNKLLQNYFSGSEFSDSLCTEIFKTELLKSAYSKIDDVYCTSGEGRYAMYYILYCASNIKSAVTEPLYIYYRGRKSGTVISLEDFEKNCQNSLQPKLIRQFLEREGNLEDQKDYLLAREKDFKDCCFDICRRCVKKEDFGQAVKILYRYFDNQDDVNEVTLYLLKRLRDQIEWNKELVESRKQLESKDTLIQELQEGCEENDRIKERLLSEMEYRDSILAELEKGWSLGGKVRIAVKKFSHMLKKFRQNSSNEK